MKCCCEKGQVMVQGQLSPTSNRTVRGWGQSLVRCARSFCCFSFSLSSLTCQRAPSTLFPQSPATSTRKDTLKAGDTFCLTSTYWRVAIPFPLQSFITTSQPSLERKRLQSFIYHKYDTGIIYYNQKSQLWTYPHHHWLWRGDSQWPNPKPPQGF